jgi:micrococcal nuclease
MRRVSRGIAVLALAGLGLGSLGVAPAAAATLPPGGTFADDDGSTHEGNIEAIAAEGITLGCNPPGNYRYCPSDGVRRDQMAAFLARAFDLPPAKNDSFTDDEGNTHEDSINRVASAGISLGLGDGTYDPSSIVTREQMASFLARAMGLAGVGGDRFDDVTGTHTRNINAVAKADVTLGCDSGGTLFCPKDQVRRDQMASFVARARGLRSTTPPPPIMADVASITDGDTIRVMVSGVNEPLRFIGVNAREVGDCLSAEATDFVEDAVAGRQVRLDRDISDRDHYDRLLRYVFVDGTLVEEELVRQGLAEAVEYPPDTKYAAAVESAQTEARAAQRGIWGTSCDTDAPPPPPPPAGNCDSSYPSVCIPPAPPDLDCGDVDAENFTVVPPDPHGFDGDSDGVGCES